MKLGISVVQFNPRGGAAAIGPALATTAQRAEAAGFSSLWVMDHFFQIPPIGQAEEPMLEGYAALAYVAGVTERIKLGTMVTGVTYRHPGILVKTVTTLDVLSGGRAYFGVGAAWFEREHLALGVPYPPLKERFERLEETLRIAKQMWSGEVAPYHGAHYQLAEPLNSPPALTRPHPPILVGGGGEQKTLRLVARYADACNLPAWSGDLSELRHKLDVLRGHCEAEGRPFAAIEKTTSGLPVTPGGGGMGISPTQAVDLLGRLAELGVDHHIFAVPVDGDAVIDLIATQVIPQLGQQTVMTS